MMLSDPQYQSFRMLTNQPSLPPPGMMPGMPPGAPQGPGGPGPGATPMSAAGGPGAMMPPGGPGPASAGAVQAKADTIQPAQPPRNPMTGKRGPLPQPV